MDSLPAMGDRDRPEVEPGRMRGCEPGGTGAETVSSEEDEAG